MQIRGLPNGVRHTRPQAGRDRPEWVVAINRNGWSQSIVTAGRDHPVRARSDAGATCRAVRRTCQSDYRVGAADVFGPGGGQAVVPAIDVKSLHAKIGELTLENDS